MERAALARTELDSFLSTVAKDATVLAPYRIDKRLLFAFVQSESGDDRSLAIDATDSNPLLSVKGIFFPQLETLYRYENGSITDVPPTGEAVVVFGCRPCDAASITLLDKLFGAENRGYDDPYYSGRRDNSTVITHACTSPCDTCFCTSVEGGPDNPRGSDIMFYSSGEQLLFSACSDRGTAFLEKYKSRLSLFDDSSADALGKVKVSVDAIAKKMPKITFEKNELASKMSESFSDDNWRGLTETCIGCGACTYLCPTCHCFDITDESRFWSGERIRSWDSCQFSLFTKHASGHNPRTSKTQRLRQRFLHKFAYTVENSGDIYCVGCGRCVIHCPVNLDIREVIGAFTTD